MTKKEIELLIELRDRIENEDWIGTCGNKADAEQLEKEHNDLLDRIDKVLARRGRSG